MDFRNQTSSPASREDSFHSNPDAHHSKPIRPPRSNASKSRLCDEESDSSSTFISGASNAIASQDKATAATTLDRISKYLEHLPHAQDPSDPCLGRDFATENKENEPPHYYTPPRDPRASNTYLRFQEMKLREPEARFSTHQAWLTLDFSQGNPVFMVGVDDTQHAESIHKQITWLRDKWIGTTIPIRYHIMEYDDEPIVPLPRTGRQVMREEDLSLPDGTFLNDMVERSNAERSSLIRPSGYCYR
ncbi:hypothetical protein D6D19_05015 [Aureobasidium pullulans]|uniref:Uncharacterized protein n=1 Tax=Aureobasidium pullulans TaxID=5580 RepID=A0A4S9A579_AURPU|nr:hypothetical protein D6D26_07638 [Aureobasidium pullulans]THW74225.1 hypothetical protein D6D19_05015 [Aureobasidium pullulans]THW78633.1 hypothetical protein D6D18_09469 [Aureobasidium pullulans]